MKHDFTQHLEATRAAIAAKNLPQSNILEFAQNTAQHGEKRGSTIAFKPPVKTPEGTNTPPKTVFETPSSVTAKPADAAQRLNRLKALAPEVAPELEACWDEAVKQLEPYRVELDHAYRIAIAVRALALWQNPKVNVRTAELIAFCPVSLLAYWIGFSESYVWKLMNPDITPGARMLERLVGWRNWKTDIECGSGDAKTLKRVRAGSVWSVRVVAKPEGQQHRVRRDDAENPENKFRDLSADIRDGRTLTAQLKLLGRPDRSRNLSTASKYPAEKGNCTLKSILKNSLNPFATYESLVKGDTVLTNRDEIYAVLHDLNSDPERGHEARAVWVDNLAKRVCMILGEPEEKSLGGWRRALWVGLKAKAHLLGSDALDTIRFALQEVLILNADNPKIKNPPAIVRVTMKRNGWADHVAAVKSLKAGRAA